MPSLKFLAVLLIFICALSSASADCSDCCLYNRCSAAYGGGSGLLLKFFSQDPVSLYGEVVQQNYFFKVDFS
jgi:hypothetical protein